MRYRVYAHETVASRRIKQLPRLVPSDCARAPVAIASTPVATSIGGNVSNQGAMCNTSSGSDGENDKPLEDVRRGDGAEDAGTSVEK
jgi:hypothetical protein